MPPAGYLAPLMAARPPFPLPVSLQSPPRSSAAPPILRHAPPRAALRSFSSALLWPSPAAGHADCRRNRLPEIQCARAVLRAQAVSGGAGAAEEVAEGQGERGGEEVGRGEARGDAPNAAEAADEGDGVGQGMVGGGDRGGEAEVGRSDGGGRGGGKGGARRRGKRVRLDELCVARWAQYSRSQVRSWILQGKVLVEGHPVTKAGAQVSEHADVIIKAQVPKYVCRAGYKLEGALQQLAVQVAGGVALDAGLSTGGFTDCLLQHGATRVYGVDVGYGQVSERIRTDPRVVVMERTNLRHLSPSDLPEQVDIVTLDLSFISVLLVMPAVVGVMTPGAHLIVLVKPQFEARRGQVGGAASCAASKSDKRFLKG
ncbi:hypothetical protein CLOM_g10067 [Closterium sp. NIES-68]|nr:hypothetical protein CLOM_g10067 [Closterium sp. NIES-68]